MPRKNKEEQEELERLEQPLEEVDDFEDLLHPEEEAEEDPFLEDDSKDFFHQENNDD